LRTPSKSRRTFLATALGALASVRVPGEAEWKQAFGFDDLATRTASHPFLR
jgi:hypothetical protein